MTKDEKGDGGGYWGVEFNVSKPRRFSPATPIENNEGETIAFRLHASRPQSPKFLTSIEMVVPAHLASTEGEAIAYARGYAKAGGLKQQVDPRSARITHRPSRSG